MGGARPDLGDQIQVDQVRTVNPEEALGIEKPLQLPQAKGDEIARGTAMQPRVVVAAGHVLDALDRDGHDRVSRAREEAPPGPFQQSAPQRL